MSNKPKIYGFCQAGCKWETIHRSDFEESVTRAIQYPNEDGNYTLEMGKTYQVFLNKNDDNTAYTTSITMRVSLRLSTTVVPIEVPFDKYKEYVKVKILGFAANSTTQSTVDYEVDDERKSTTVDTTNNPITRVHMVAYDSPKCYVVNDNGELTAQKLFVRYADSLTGANMSETYTGQYYMGTYSGMEASENASDYQWVRTKGEEGDSVVDDGSITEEKLSNELNNDIKEGVNLNASHEDVTYVSEKHTDIPYCLDIPNDTLPYVKVNRLEEERYTSKNLFVFNDTEETSIEGGTYKIENGVITLNGTFTATIQIMLKSSITISSGTYWYNGFNDNSATKPKISIWNGGTWVRDLVIESYSDCEIPITEEKTITRITLSVGSKTYNNYQIKPMLVRSDTIPNEFEEGFEGVRYNKRTEIKSVGTNKFNFNDIEETSINGGTYSIKDGVITLNGTFTSAIRIYLASAITLPSGTYWYNGFNNGITKPKVSLWNGATWIYDIVVEGYSDAIYKLTEEKTINSISINVANLTFNNYKIKPMLVKSEIVPTEFKPYFEEVIDTSTTNLPTYIRVEEYGNITFKNEKNSNVNGEVILYYKKNENRSNTYKNYSLPVLYLEGSTDGISKDNKVNLNYVYGERSGTCTLKWQGSSSINYSKKNYTIKFDNAFEAATGWGEQSKYCLKANFIDFSHARNVVSAKLWGQVVKSRTTPNEALNTLVNGGAIDGFPIVVVINGKYQGLYTFNIPKDGWMFGMGSGTNECIVCGETWCNATYFKGEALLDGSDFEIEYITDEDNTEWAVTSFNNIYNALQNVGASNFESTVGQYVDIDSVIDYYIYTSLIQAIDCTGKNYIMATYDGVKWFMSAYDLDSTYGLYADGKKYIGLMYGSANFEGWAMLNTLMWCIKNYCKDKVKARYEELRSDVLSEENVALEFLNFTKDIPKELYDEEVKLWRDIPSTSNNNVHQIIDYYNLTCKHRDKQIENL